MRKYSMPLHTDRCAIQRCSALHSVAWAYEGGREGGIGVRSHCMKSGSPLNRETGIKNGSPLSREYIRLLNIPAIHQAIRPYIRQKHTNSLLVPPYPCGSLCLYLCPATMQNSKLRKLANFHNFAHNLVVSFGRNCS